MYVSESATNKLYVRACYHRKKPQRTYMLKQSAIATPTRFSTSHLPYQIDHCDCSGYFMALYNLLIVQVPVFLYLWHWVKVKIIQTGIMLYCLVMTIIIASLKKYLHKCFILLHSVERCMRKWSQHVLFSADHVTPQPRWRPLTVA